MEYYKSQVALLLKIIPYVAEEDCFALHGGTAINLFVRDMPRLSIDIDLTYLPIEDRDITFENINASLDNIRNVLKKRIPNVQVHHQKEALKLQISYNSAQIKLEVNQGMRGVIDKINKRVLCDVAQEEFDAFCAINVVPFGQLYGGKICAALDRQHPRDLFDIKYLLENEGFTKEIKAGFLLALLSSNRPIEEILFPNLTDQQDTFNNQFEGMTFKPFSYKDFKRARVKLLETIHDSLSAVDKKFLISFENSEPNWEIYDFEKFPAIQWKLMNLEKVKNAHPKKHAKGLNSLKSKLLI